MCSIHDRPLEMFCEGCNQLLCTRCAHEVHHRHDCDYVDSLFDENSYQDAKQYLKELNSQLQQLVCAVDALNNQEKDIINVGKAKKQEIRRHTEILINKLHQSGRQLEDEVNRIVEEKVRRIAQQKTEKQTAINQIVSSAFLAEKNLSSKCRIELLKKQLDLANTNFKNNHLESMLIEFKPTNEKGTAVGALVYKNEESHNFDPSSYLCSKKFLIAKAGQQKRMDIHLSTKPTEVVLIHTSTAIGTQCIIEEQPSILSPSFHILCTPKYQGIHSLVATNMGTSSPCATIRVLPSPGSPCQEVGKIEGFHSPCGIAVTANRNILVTELQKPDVAIVSNVGLRLKTVDHSRSAVSSFFAPTGLAINSNHIFIVDCKGNSIQKCTIDGSYLFQTKLKDSSPHDVAINKHTGRLYITATNIHCIYVYDNGLQPLCCFGHKGTGPGEFNTPTGITINSHGEIYVCDQSNSRVQKFSENGKYITQFGKVLRQPWGITSDANDTIYVTDSKMFRVIIFNADGDLLGSLGGEGQGPGQFLQPRGIAVDNDGQVYVCDSCKNEVIIF